MGFCKGKGDEGAELLFFFLLLVLIWPFCRNIFGFDAEE